MTATKPFANNPLVQLCRDFMRADNTATVSPDLDPDHEGWTGELKLTPRMVEQILLANTEI